MKNIILYLFIICSVIVMVGHVYVVTKEHSDGAMQMWEEINQNRNPVDWIVDLAAES